MRRVLVLVLLLLSCCFGQIATRRKNAKTHVVKDLECALQQDGTTRMQYEWTRLVQGLYSTIPTVHTNMTLSILEGIKSSVQQDNGQNSLDVSIAFDSMNAADFTDVQKNATKDLIVLLCTDVTRAQDVTLVSAVSIGTGAVVTCTIDLQAVIENEYAMFSNQCVHFSMPEAETSSETSSETSVDTWVIVVACVCSVAGVAALLGIGYWFHQKRNSYNQLT